MEYPYLIAPNHTAIDCVYFSRAAYFDEVGMIDGLFLEGWGTRLDCRFGGNVLEHGSFHKGRLHGIGGRIDQDEDGEKIIITYL